jgi:FSR family fosmidomycin resistance protein-like MFS transporter
VLLSILVGVIFSLSFPVILVYVQELFPGRVGLVGGLYFGFAFGLGGIGAAALGVIADWQGIDFVFRLCSALPLLGLLTVLLPRQSRDT